MQISGDMKKMWEAAKRLAKKLPLPAIPPAKPK